MPRNTLAQLLAGQSIDLSAATDMELDALLNQAQGEGVMALLGQRVAQISHASPTFLQAVAASERALAASSLLLQAECRRVLAALPPEMPVLLLKGSALAYWLYPQAFLRECSDIDLLLPTRADAEQAADLLAALGYALHHQPDDLAHELLCRRELGNGMQVDLDVHWRLANAPVFASLFGFAELYATSIPLPQLGPNARGLGPVHAFVHACLHRALNVYTGIGDRLKWLYDLHLLAGQFDAGDWQALEKTCVDRRISGVCAEGIEAATLWFGSIAPPTVLESLNAARAHDRLDARRMGEWRYMQWRNLVALPSLGARLRWLWQSLSPPTGYLEELYGPDQGRLRLLAERSRRAWQRLTS